MIGGTITGWIGTTYCPKCREYTFIFYPPHEDETSCGICDNCKYVETYLNGKIIDEYYLEMKK